MKLAGRSRVGSGWRATLVGDGADVEIIDRSPAGKVCSDNALVRRFVESTGAKTTPKQAWTDVARLTAAGIDAVNFGPGLTSQAHQQGEFMLTANLTRAFQMLRGFFEG